MTPRRSQLERHLDVLKVVAQHGPIRQTHVMYKANLSWYELKRVLQTLGSLGLVVPLVDRDGVHYSISSLGRDLLTHMAQIETILFPVAQQHL